MTELVANSFPSLFFSSHVVHVRPPAMIRVVRPGAAVANPFPIFRALSPGHREVPRKLWQLVCLLFAHVMGGLQVRRILADLQVQATETTEERYSREMDAIK